jgi:hypothetical protein
MALRTEQEYIDADDSLKQVRRIIMAELYNEDPLEDPDTYAQINNYNISYFEDPEDPATAYPIVYLDYLGKITKLVVQDQAAYDEKFDADGNPVLVSPAAKANAETLTLASDKALGSATNACAAMATLGNISADLKDAAKAAEEAAGKLLTAVTEAAGVVGEVLSKVETAIGEIGQKIADAATAVAQLIEKGFQELADAISSAMGKVNGIIENAVDGLNKAIGPAAEGIGEAINETIDAVDEAISAASEAVSELFEGIAAGECNVVSQALAAVVAIPAGAAGVIKTALVGATPQGSRMLTAAGEVTNSGIDKELPYADIQYRGKLTRMYYQDADKMQARFGTLGETGGLLGAVGDVVGDIGNELGLT